MRSNEREFVFVRTHFFSLYKQKPEDAFTAMPPWALGTGNKLEHAIIARTALFPMNTFSRRRKPLGYESGDRSRPLKSSVTA